MLINCELSFLRFRPPRVRGALLPSCVRSHFQTSLFSAAWRAFAASGLQGAPLLFQIRSRRRRACGRAVQQPSRAGCRGGATPRPRASGGRAAPSRRPTDRRPRSTRRAARLLSLTLSLPLSDPTKLELEGDDKPSFQWLVAPLGARKGLVVNYIHSTNPTSGERLPFFFFEHWVAWTRLKLGCLF